MTEGARRLRYSRQARLVEVGDAGQERLAAMEATVAAEGLAGWVAARYLAGAGVGALVVRDDAAAQAARAVDGALPVRVAPRGAPGELHGLIARAGLHFVDAAAREVATGALIALVALRRAWGLAGEEKP